MRILEYTGLDTTRVSKAYRKITEATKIPDADAGEAQREAQPLRYLHPDQGAVHLLDKPISFDNAQ